ncbi:DUF938 domain-containing protein [Blastomonas sp. AAP53]|uniref:DUF938 domain-containing protein n=1 Tax=Blastomonas sp. AAP53 TaxID=1248760 RepID=UPI0002D59619|nr:DUF938 domain-containing protein [Blastomonas sp. AAP53]
MNMLHISPSTASAGLFRQAPDLLSRGTMLYPYGPFARHDVMTAQNNPAFEASLKQRNSCWGLRNLADIDAIAQGHGFAPAALIAMPANNLSLLYRRC